MWKLITDINKISSKHINNNKKFHTGFCQTMKKKFPNLKYLQHLPYYNHMSLKQQLIAFKICEFLVARHHTWYGAVHKWHPQFFLTFMQPMTSGMAKVGGQGECRPSQILADQLTLSQTDYAPHISACPPSRFLDLAPSMNDQKLFFSQNQQIQGKKRVLKQNWYPDLILVLFMYTIPKLSFGHWLFWTLTTF